jgi:hypothetical protein
MAPVMKPQEIEDEEHEQVMDRVAAVDVAKASGMVCTPTRTPSWSWPGTWSPSRSRKVTLQATSVDYWRIWFYLLEARGLDVQVVNARKVKAAPSRPKTDKLDA